MEHGHAVQSPIVHARLVVGAMLLSAVVVGGPAALAVAGGSSDAAEQIETALVEGRRLLRSNQPEKALALTKKAEKLRREPCNECLLLESQAYYQLHRHDDGIKAATRVLEANAPVPLMVQAHNLLALNLQRDGHMKPADRPRVDGEYREAIRLSGNDSAPLRFNLAAFLLRTDRQEEGLAMLREVLDEGVDPETSRRIRLLLDEPECIDGTCAPEYAVTTTGGSFFSRSDLKGKAVLLYFWGTGGDPSASISTLNGLWKRHKDEPFAEFAISFDTDEKTLVEFGTTHGIEFPLCYDRGGTVTGTFGVRHYPVAVVIDHRGHIVWQSLVSAPTHMTAMVGSAIKKAREAAAEAGGRP